MIKTKDIAQGVTTYMASIEFAYTAWQSKLVKRGWQKVCAY